MAGGQRLEGGAAGPHKAVAYSVGGSGSDRGTTDPPRTAAAVGTALLVVGGQGLGRASPSDSLHYVHPAGLGAAGCGHRL